jgi:hypothetical protein
MRLSPGPSLDPKEFSRLGWRVIRVGGLMKIRTQIQSGRLVTNHNAKGVRIKTKVRAGAMSLNHNAKRV